MGFVPTTQPGIVHTMWWYCLRVVACLPLGLRRARWPDGPFFGWASGTVGTLPQWAAGCQATTRPTIAARMRGSSVDQAAQTRSRSSSTRIPQEAAPEPGFLPCFAVLLNRRRGNPLPRVRIPPCPLFRLLLDRCPAPLFEAVEQMYF